MRLLNDTDSCMKKHLIHFDFENVGLSCVGLFYLSFITTFSIYVCWSSNKGIGCEDWIRLN
jgi:hypothetical protein